MKIQITGEKKNVDKLLKSQRQFFKAHGLEVEVISGEKKEIKTEKPKTEKKATSADKLKGKLTK